MTHYLLQKIIAAKGFYVTINEFDQKDAPYMGFNFKAS
jgi:hypothetical protein